MAIIKANYTKSRQKIKASVRYIQHRPGTDGQRLTRTLFGTDGPLTREQAYELIDRAGKGTTFFRFVLSPDPRTEDTERDLALRQLTEQVFLALSERLGHSVEYIAAVHADHAAHRHVHVLALIPGRLTVADFRLLRGQATALARFQRRERDLALGRVPEQPQQGGAVAPGRGQGPGTPRGGGRRREERQNVCPVCGRENCRLHEVGLELTKLI